MTRMWKDPVRAPEDGGAGGGDRTQALEARLSKFESMLEESLTRGRKLEQDDRARQFEDAERRVAAAVEKADGELQAAEGALATALDDGDAPTIAKRQRELSETAARRERIKAEADDVRARLRRAREEKPKPAEPEKDKGEVDTTNRDAWMKKHSSWYGVDEELTKAAHEISDRVISSRVFPTGSEGYFNAIDSQLRARFPDRFEGSPSGISVSGGGDGGRKSGGQQRIPASVAEGYERMGFDMKDPKVVERLVASRQVAVEKGLLPETPVTGRVFTR